LEKSAIYSPHRSAGTISARLGALHINRPML
jgi:hypothetical protein